MAAQCVPRVYRCEENKENRQIELSDDEDDLAGDDGSPERCSSEKGRKDSELSNGFRQRSITVGRRRVGKGDITDYQRQCTIGTGTFGRVYLMKHKTSGNFYALKVMNISTIIKMKQVAHVHSEKRILEKLCHPFIISLHWAYHDERCLYMLLDYAGGGELFSYLRSSEKFGNRATRFYAAEIILALEYMHKRETVYRDLKPENLLLDKEGHLKITDFGFAKQISDRTWTLCGTPEYLAPEVITNRGHNKAVDWWSLGVLIYEMHAGYPPFYGDTALEIYDKILDGRFKFPKGFNAVAKDIVSKLLQSDRINRLGNMKAGAEDVKNHKWLKSVDWDQVYDREVKPPIIPTLYHDGDTGNFDTYEEGDEEAITDASQEQIELFREW